MSNSDDCVADEAAAACLTCLRYFCSDDLIDFFHQNKFSLRLLLFSVLGLMV